MSARPPIPLYIWRNSPSLATTRVQGQASTLPAQWPAFPAGNVLPLAINLTDGLGNLEDLTGRSYWAGLGNLNAPVTAGTFFITDGNGQSTSLLAYNASANDVQAALNVLNNSTGPNGALVFVQGGNGAPYSIFWQTNGPQPLLAINTSDLLPLATSVITEIQLGNSTANEIQMIRVVQQSYALQTSFTITSFTATGNLTIDSIPLRQEMAQAPGFNAYFTILENDGSGELSTICQTPVYITGEGLISPTNPTMQIFNTTILAGSYNQAITFPVAFANTPTKFLATISFPGTPTENLEVTIGNRSTTGCIAYFNGAPSVNCILTLEASP